jgi:hypothetical protein
MAVFAQKLARDTEKLGEIVQNLDFGVVFGGLELGLDVKVDLFRGLLRHFVLS